MTRVIYEYPDDAVDGDAFVVEDVDISPSTVTIRLKRYVPHWRGVERARQIECVLDAADEMVKELERGTSLPGKLFLLLDSYRRMRRAVR